MNFTIKAVLFLIAVFSSNSPDSSDRQRKSEENGLQGADVSFEFHQILFAPGMPRVGDSIYDSVIQDGDQIGKLAENARLLKKIPAFQVEIFGATDNSECTDVDCYDLSTRRARMVYDWLRSKAVPSESLYAFRGFALEKPINGNEDEDARQRSRRVEFSSVRNSYGRSSSLIDSVGRR